MTKKDLEDFKCIGWEIDSWLDIIEQDKRLSWHEKVKKWINDCQHNIEKLKDRRQAIIDQVNSLDDPMHQRILSERYFFGKTLDEISKEIGYSYHYTSRQFTKAIKEFEAMA